MDLFGYLFFNLFLKSQNKRLKKYIIKFLLFFITRIAQSKNGLSDAANVQQHARLRQMVIEEFDDMREYDDMREFDYDGGYEDLIECMEYEANVKYFVFPKFIT